MLGSGLEIGWERQATRRPPNLLYTRNVSALRGAELLLDFRAAEERRAADFLATTFLAGLRFDVVFFAVERLTILRAPVFLFTVLRALDGFRRALEAFFAAGFDLRADEFFAGIFDPSSCAAVLSPPPGRFV